MLTIDLSGLTAVVTGGSSGIGLATAAIFLQAGANVAICGRSAARLAEAEATLGAGGAGGAGGAEQRLLAAAADVLDAVQMHAFAEQVAARFGGADMLVNNAGQGRLSTFADTTDEAWREELNLKIFSLVYPIRAFLSQLVASRARRGDAAIVCVNSLLALQPEPHMVATSAARAAAQNLIRSLATEFAPQGVRVNSILLGLVESGQWRRRFAGREDKSQSWEQWTGALATKKAIQLGRLGKPEEAARAIFHLATPLASYTTGSHIDVCGGLAHHI
jgi:NAD(P)-dependent dehydrogenase (short-subunit alcohol dehydrogenase family)